MVGLPGGINSPYFNLLQEANVNKMELREGKGNLYEVRGLMPLHVGARMFVVRRPQAFSARADRNPE